MPDSIRALFHIDDVLADFKAIDKAVDRAAMWSVREVARVYKGEAKRNTPVYQGKDAVSRKQHKESGGALTGPPVKGLLKASWSSSKQLKRYGPGSYSVVVAPRGPRADLYAAKVDKRKPIVRPAYDAALAAAEAVHAKAYEKAMRRR